MALLIYFLKGKKFYYAVILCQLPVKLEKLTDIPTLFPIVFPARRRLVCHKPCITSQCSKSPVQSRQALRILIHHRGRTPAVKSKTVTFLMSGQHVRVYIFGFYYLSHYFEMGFNVSL